MADQDLYDAQQNVERSTLGASEGYKSMESFADGQKKAYDIWKTAYQQEFKPGEPTFWQKVMPGLVSGLTIASGVEKYNRTGDASHLMAGAAMGMISGGLLKEKMKNQYLSDLGETQREVFNKALDPSTMQKMYVEGTGTVGKNIGEAVKNRGTLNLRDIINNQLREQGFNEIGTILDTTSFNAYKDALGADLTQSTLLNLDPETGMPVQPVAPVKQEEKFLYSKPVPQTAFEKKLGLKPAPRIIVPNPKYTGDTLQADIAKVNRGNLPLGYTSASKREEIESKMKQPGVLADNISKQVKATKDAATMQADITKAVNQAIKSGYDVAKVKQEINQAAGKYPLQIQNLILEAGNKALSQKSKVLNIKGDEKYLEAVDLKGKIEQIKDDIQNGKIPKDKGNNILYEANFRMKALSPYLKKYQQNSSDSSKEAIE